jgi:hypothetical protein
VSEVRGTRAVFSAELGRSKPDSEAFRRLAAPYIALEPTPNSPRSCVALAIEHGSPPESAGVHYTVSRHWASPREPAEFPTDVKGVVAMCLVGTSFPCFLYVGLKPCYRFVAQFLDSYYSVGICVWRGGRTT